MSMKNPREVAIKILENAKKALKEKIESLEKAEGKNKKVERIPKDHPVQPLKPEQSAKDKATCGHCGLSWDDGISTSLTPAPSARCPFEYYHIHSDLEKADGKNTAQLNEFKGIPQPPAPKAPEKAIAPTPTIPQPKMPSLGKPSRPLGSFMKSRMDKGDNSSKIGAGKHGLPKSKEKGVHQPPTKTAYDMGLGSSAGESVAGFHARMGSAQHNQKTSPQFAENAREMHKEKLSELKAMPKPALGKAEEMNKAKIYDIKSKKMIADHGEPEKTTPPKGNLKAVSEDRKTTPKDGKGSNSFPLLSAKTDGTPIFGRGRTTKKPDGTITFNRSPKKTK